MMHKALLMAAAAGSALAFNSHRHGQHHVDRREAQAEVTVYETVIVTAGQDVPAPSVEAVANEQPKEVYNEAPVVEVVPTPDAVAEPQQTTLATAVRPAATDDQWTSSGQADTDSVSVQGVSSSKRGMCYNDVNLAQTFGSKCTKCTWAYNWDSESYGLDTKYSFVPMLWGNIDIHTSRWKKNADASIARGSKAVLSFNEPDHAGQAAMTPAQAAAAHNKWMNPYGGKVLVGAPAVTNSGTKGEGLDWLKNFFTACNSVSGGCKVDFCPIHWYSEAQYGDTLLKHIEDAHNICGGKPIWLTEFAPIGSDQQKADFLVKYLPKLDAISYLDHYSYFMVASNNLMSGTNALSVYGQKYATL